MRTSVAFVLLVLCVAAFPLAAQTPQPKVDFACSSQEALIGDTTTFDLTFDSSGATGFGPFIDLLLDHAGADGITSAPCDGLTFLGATVIGKNPEVPLTPISQIQPTPCSSGGAIAHPYAGSGVSIAGMPAGGQLVTLALPFGSFEVDQPRVTIRVTVRISSLADEGTPLKIRARAGFRYGDDALDNPSAGGQPILDPPASTAAGAWPEVLDIIPRAVLVTKSLLDPENEVVPGPNFPAQFGLRVRVAPGQTVTGLPISDCVPIPGIEFQTIASKIASAQTQIKPPGDCFTVNYPSLTGPASGDADFITAGFIATNASLLAGPHCVDDLENTAYQGGQWKPADPRDDEQPIFGIASTSFKKKTIVLKKSAKLLGTAPAPVSQIEYHLKFAISDYAQMRDIVIDDYISDGQTFVLGSARFSVEDKFGGIVNALVPDLDISSSWPWEIEYRCPTSTTTPPAPCSVPPSAAGGVKLAGSTRLIFFISDAMKSAPGTPYPTGTLAGGLVGIQGSAAEGELVFRVDVNDKHRFGPHSSSDDGFVDKHDPIYDTAEIRATLVAAGNPTCRDDSTTCLSVPDGPLEKRIVAKNGAMLAPVPDPVATPLPQFTRDDLITYRITKTIPSGDAEELTIRDWFPQPVLDVSGMSALEGTAVPKCGTLPPPLNQPCFIAPGVVPVPTLHVDAATNSLTFAFGNLNDTTNQPATVDIYVTLKITQDPFADGLLLTNEAQECESDSYGNRYCREAIAQFELNEPLVRLRKGIICAPPMCVSDHRRSWSGVFPPVRCSGPCPRVAGVTSATASGFFSGSAGVDAGDVVTYMIVVDNIGKGPYGAFDVHFKDALPAGSPGSIVPGSVCVSYGDGTAVSHKLVVSSASIDVTLNGALAASPSSSGHNLVVVTYDVKIDAQAALGSCVVNSADLLGYSNISGGTNFVTAGFAGPVHEAVSTCVSSRLTQKTILSASEHPGFAPASDRVWIGEVVRYRLRLHLPEGKAAPLVIQDVLPAGFTMISPPVVTADAASAVTWTTPVQWTPAGLIDLGTVTNGDQDPECEFLNIEVEARVENIAVNADGVIKPNFFVATANGKPFGTSNTVTMRVGEPLLTLKKVVYTSEGRFAAFRILIENKGNAPAFDVVIDDTPGSTLIACANVPNGDDLIFLPPQTTGAVGTIVQPSTPVKKPSISISMIAPGATVLLSYYLLNFDVSDCPNLAQLCSTMTNSAVVRGTSLPLNGSHPASSGHERTGAGTGEDDFLASDTASLCKPCPCIGSIAGICPIDECP